MNKRNIPYCRNAYAPPNKLKSLKAAFPDISQRLESAAAPDVLNENTSLQDPTAPRLFRARTFQ